MFNPLPYSTCETLSDQHVHVSRNATLNGFSPKLAQPIQDKLDALQDTDGIRDIRLTVTGTGNQEAYDLTIQPDALSITAYGDKGAFYAMQTLLRLLEEPELPCVKLHNEPVCPFRGVKVFLPEPSPKGIADFKQVIDFIARFRYNTLVVEIGGAMEYKTHPEINEGWLEYAAFMNEYSGKPAKLFKSIPWSKNSVHATNGGGKVVSQDQVRELVAYCEERGLEVTPELPSLSHCDFLLTRHHELAERPEDPYPDTICPNHPGYYPLLFDLIDELIQVFHPKRIHLGHDEYYSIGLCPRCKGKPAPEIYADDIRKCYDYLKKRNITMMIWSEKLLNAHFLGTGHAIGGAHVKSWVDPENGPDTPATWPAIDLIPQDIQMMHWYWSIDRNLEQSYIQRNMTMTFGNMRSDSIPEWKRRRQAPNFIGTCCSNWGSMDWLTMQRNALLSEIVYASALHWNPSLDSDDFQNIRDWALDELYHERRNNETAKQAIEVVHTTTQEQKYHCFYDGVLVEKEKDLLGWHLFQDDNGRQLTCPVYYGCNVAAQNVSMERGELGFIHWQKDHTADPSDIYRVDRRFWEVSYETRPENRDGKLYCRCIYPLTEQVGNLTYQGFKPAEGFTGTVQLAEFKLIRP